MEKAVRQVNKERERAREGERGRGREGEREGGREKRGKL